MRPTVETLVAKFGKQPYDEFTQTLQYYESDFKGRQLLDIGANIGFVSLLGLAWGAKRAVAVECDETNFKTLQENLSPYSDAMAVRAAAHGFASRVSIIDDKTNCKVIPNEKEGTPAKPLDTLVSLLDPNDNDMILKLDTEGAEYDLLLCAPASAVRRFSIILLETHALPHIAQHPARTPAFLKTYMDYLGYKIRYESKLCWFYDNGHVAPVGDGEMSSMKMYRQEMP